MQCVSLRRADVNASDQFCWTPLHHACHAGQLDIIKLLVEAGAAVNTPTLSGATPLMRAIESSRPCCVEYLIKAGATVTAENKSGTEAALIMFSHLYIVKYFFSHSSLAMSHFFIVQTMKSINYDRSSVFFYLLLINFK